MKIPLANGLSGNSGEGERKTINSELWHACAGPLVSLPPVGSLVVYFPQGHSEQVAASMHKEIDSIPSYPSLPSKLICVLLSATLHADAETDEVYAQMTLQPVNKYDKEALLASELGLKQNKQPAEFFCKTLTASDTSTHGGFSVPRRAAEKIFPPLDFAMQPPAQELVAKDLHDVSWTFRHIYRGQPKRHLLTTGWSVFVSTKRLFAGDSVLFIRDEKSQLLLGIRRATRQQHALASSVLSSDSMHIGILAAAAHAAANNSPFTIFYNPRASPSEFVVPLAKYNKAMYTQVSLGMRFRMMFEREESGVRRYMGTITGIADLDPVRWKNSQWRNLQVGWDESTAIERRTRVSLWEIEPVTTPFYICPPPFFRPKFPKQPGITDDETDVDNAFRRATPWLNDDISMKGQQSSIFPGLSLVQWMAMQQNSQSQPIPSTSQPSFIPSLPQSAIQDSLSTDNPSRILNFQSQSSLFPNLHFPLKSNQQTQQLDQFQQLPIPWPQQPQPPFEHQQQQQQQHQHQKQQQQQRNSVHLLQQQQSQKQQSFDQKQHQLLSNQVLSQNQLQTQHIQVQLQQSSSATPPVLQFHQQQQQPQQFQMQLLQKLQQQQQLPQFTPHLQPQLSQQIHQKPPQLLARSHSNFTETDAPSCSTSVSPTSLQNKAQEEEVVPRVESLLQEIQSKPEGRLKHEDQLDASSATSFCLDGGGVNECFPFPPICLNGDVQIGGVNGDGLLPDAMMSRGFGLGFTNQREIETEISTADVSSHSFGVADMDFRPGCSNDAAVNENGLLSRGVWGNQPQPQRMRTYTKVQKRGSVGRSIDVTRYRDYDDLRRDLARMFGIEGQLEDPHRTDWKLVYVDHENDILLVGDDPWEEFVTCVQSIKILSAAEVQQILV